MQELSRKGRIAAAYAIKSVLNQPNYVFNDTVIGLLSNANYVLNLRLEDYDSAANCYDDFDVSFHYVSELDAEQKELVSFILLNLSIADDRRLSQSEQECLSLLSVVGFPILNDHQLDSAQVNFNSLLENRTSEPIQYYEATFHAKYYVLRSSTAKINFVKNELDYQCPENPTHRQKAMLVAAIQTFIYLDKDKNLDQDTMSQVAHNLLDRAKQLPFSGFLDIDLKPYCKQLEDALATKTNIPEPIIKDIPKNDVPQKVVMSNPKSKKLEDKTLFEFLTRLVKQVLSWIKKQIQ